MRMTHILIMFFLLLGSIWAATSEIEQFVSGFGKVIPSSKLKNIQHLEGGIVSEIYITEGQEVKTGEALFKINNQTSRSQLEANKLDSAALSMRLHRLAAEQKGEDFVIENPKYPELYINERHLFYTRQKELKNQLDVIEQDVVQKQLELKKLQSRRANYTSEYNTAKRSNELSYNLFSRGALSEAKYLEDKMRLQDVQSRLSEAKRHIPIIESEMSQARTQRDQVTQERQNEMAEEVSRLQLKRKTQEQQTLSSQDQISRTVIKSPIDGTVNKVYLTTREGILPPGGVLADILPLHDLLVIEGKIAAKDRGKIWPGQKVNVRITAYDYRDYGMLEGVLTDISVDSFSEQDGNHYYRVKTKIKPQEGQKIIPGMTAELHIISGKKTVLNYLISPLFGLSRNALREP